MFRRLWLPVAVVTCLLSACKKKDASRTDLLTGRTWRTTAHTRTETTASGTNTVDRYKSYGSCFYDNRMTISSGNQVTYDTGANHCYSLESQSYENQWFLSADEQRLFIENIHPMIGENSHGPLRNYEIVSLTQAELTIKESWVFQDYGGVETTVVNVYTFAPSN